MKLFKFISVDEFATERMEARMLLMIMLRIVNG